MLEILGYVASLVVLISLVMSSIKRLRWINLFGAVLFSAYGFMINSIPTGLMNLGIVFINIYYLVQIYSKEDYFTYLIVNHESRFLRKLLKTQTEEVEKFFPGFDLNTVTEEHFCFISLRNLNAAGVLILKPSGEELEVVVDYALKQYRDFKTTMFIIEREAKHILEKGFNKVSFKINDSSQMKYLSKMGYTKENDKFVYNIEG